MIALKHNSQQAISLARKTWRSAVAEAPASCNTYIDIAGRKVQVTLRDTNETRMLERLATLLDKYPIDPTVKPEGWCEKHQVQMKRHAPSGKTPWWSHRISNSEWCKGK